MDIDKDLYEKIKEYCQVNGLKPKKYINDLLSEAFTKDVYGEIPRIFPESEKMEDHTEEPEAVSEENTINPEKVEIKVDDDIYSGPFIVEPIKKNKRRLK